MTATNSISINKFDGVALVTLPYSLDDSLAKTLQREITEMVSHELLEGVIIDISCLEIVDSYMTRILQNINNAVELMGTPVVISGMCPEIALTLVELRIHLPDLDTALGVEQAMAKISVQSDE